MSGSVPAEEVRPPIPALARLEEAALGVILGLMVALPIFATVTHWLGMSGFAGANVWVQRLNLVLAFVGTVVAARAGEHLNLSTGELLKLDPTWQRRIGIFTTAVTSAVTAMLAVGAWIYLRTSAMKSVEVLPGGIPAWWVEAVMPLGFFGTAFYFLWVGNKDWVGRVVSALAIALVPLIFLVGPASRGPIVLVGTAVLMGAVAFGAPIYTVMGGLAMLFFYGQDVTIAAVPVETVGLVTKGDLVAIPLFTLAGYLLAEGGASKRLVTLFREWFGWLPGGQAFATVLVCAFFTTFTGASGVTILALGGLLLPSLVEAGYKERFAIGLLIASGSIGLLFPPSLPVILYGVQAGQPIDQLYIAGIVPGLLLVGLLVIAGIWHAHSAGVKRSAFRPSEAVAALKDGAWEVALPIGVLFGYFGGYVTIFEASAFTAGYAFLSEVVVHRDLHWKDDVPRVFAKTGTLMGGVLIILGLALGFTNFLVDAEIASTLTDWVRANVASKVAFLLVLNLFLLVVGCLMDIFSAIVVVVPLIIPLAEVFGVHPIHLGILFLANLELGYLTPPVGMNLFLASYRFEKPLTQVYRMGLPFLGILLVGVLVITYVPSLTTFTVPAPGEDAVDVEAILNSDSTPGELPLGEMNLDALLADDDDAAPAAGTDPSKPLGNLDLDALLSDDDDDSASAP